MKSTKKVQFVELEFSTSESLLVKKQKLEIKEDSQIFSYIIEAPKKFGAFLLQNYISL
ncbi:hypothetical protein KU06062659_660003 [Flavobacterium psychrophilum]|nr:hypothetical protein DK150_180018 [Flavobacterium psychrophilum]SNA79897.1 hypothetical protein FI070_320153 [Flavobacterium psychrophilum]SNA83758.1 hypothetical protein DK095_60018 [Flavobacterium psychrophilum]SNA88192.1 hypothetical protein FI146_840052 [Flavobacterium psychrophilum]SNB02389.1 hypothetical protein FPC831_1950004 [Flavobacterium psychrophilum]